MSKIAIVTDSNSGISQTQAKEMGIYVVPMPFLINGKEYLDGIDLFPDEFYKFLEEDADVSTSQPSPDSVMKLWDELLKEYDAIVHIPKSTGCQQSENLCDTALFCRRCKSICGSWHECRADLQETGRRSIGVQHLCYGNDAEISEKRRTYHTGSSGSWNHAASETGIADPW